MKSEVELLTLHYKEYGDKDGSLIVFLHGGGVSSWMWDKQVQQLTQYHCVAIDLPEQGLSNRSANFSIKYSAEQINEIIEKIANGKKIAVVGFSLGAQVAIQMLSLKPDLIDYAIINSALVRPMPFARKWIAPSIRFTFPIVKNKFFSKLQAKVIYVDHEYFDKYYDESSRMKADTLIRILKENMSFEIPNDFKKSKAKMLVTVGEREKAVMKKSAMDIVSSNPNCTGVIFPNVGHGISLANPHYFNQLVDKWIHEGIMPDDVKVIVRS